MNNFLFILTAILLVSCGGKTPSKEAASAITANELPALSYTIYTGKTELFLECRTFVVGDTSKIAAHFTCTKELFSAITDGSINMTIQADGGNVSQTAKVSSSPGIFRYAIVPNHAGMSKLIFDIQTPEYTDKIVIDKIPVYPDKKTAMASKKEEPKANEISYLKEQAWKIEFANIPVVRQDFYEIIKTTGEILPAPGDEMIVAANADGIVIFSGNRAVVGTSVGKGEMLFAVSGANLTNSNTETRFQQAKVAFEKAKSEFDRAQELTKDNIVSQKDFLEIKAKYETEQVNYMSLSRNYQTGAQKVVSPISGFVKNVLVVEGQYVSLGQPLASISQNRRLVLKADVSQKYFSKLPAVTSANFKTVYDNKTYNIESLNGKLLSYGKSNGATSLFIPVTFSLDNKDEIVPGSLVDVFLKLHPIPGAIVVPVSALIEEQGLFFVYVQTAGESFVKRELALGGSDGINVQVLSGLHEGDRVVTTGAYQLKLATMSGTIPAHGHAH